MRVRYKWSKNGLKLVWEPCDIASRYNVTISQCDNQKNYKNFRNLLEPELTIEFGDFDCLTLRKSYCVNVRAYNDITLLDSGKIFTKGIDVVGHRGSMDKAPQNTLAGLLAAKKNGYDAVEADFIETKEGELLVFHDDFLDVCGRPDLNIRDVKAEDLKKYPIVKGNRVNSIPTQYIPTLHKFILTASRLGIGLYLHLKDENNISDEGISKIYDFLLWDKMRCNTVVFSSNKDACERLASSKLTAGYLRIPKSENSAENAVKFAKSVGAEVVVCEFNEFFSGEAAKRARAEGLKIGYYHVSDYISAAKVANRGVDFLITDRNFFCEKEIG